MAAVTTVVEGNIKFREGKKWKNRWCVIKKPSPVADRLQISLYKNVYESSKPGGKCKSVFTVESFLGLNSSVSYDREPHVLAIICEKNVFLFAFDLREDMIQFEIKIRQSLGEEHQFLVKVVKAPPGSKVPKDQIYFIIHDTRFCLTAHFPPKIILLWNIVDLRRYGVDDGKFCFEGGASCGKGAGLFVLQSDQIETIADIIHFAATGKMSNSHRKFKNRSSQVDLGSHLIADIPSMPSHSSSSHLHHFHHSGAKNPLQGALPSTLNCCQPNQTGSAESEDWNWYKRHSVSVMDYRRIAALREKSGVENRDQLSVGIYDVPPNHDRKCGFNIPAVIDENGYDHPRSFLPAADGPARMPVRSDCAHNHEYFNTRPVLNDNCNGHYKYLKGNSGSMYPSKEHAMEAQSRHCEIDDDSQVASMSRKETLQKLQKQEYNIQKEMKLLDEMLQNCSGHNLDPPNNFVGRKFQFPPEASQKPTYSNYDELPARPRDLAPIAVQGSSVRHGESDFGSSFSGQDFKIISGNISMRRESQWPNDRPHKRISRPALSLNKSLPEETPISPLFYAKLNSIPAGSKLNAPLPYVNLSRYDDDSNSHVYLPGSADCLLVAKGSNPNGVNAGHGQNPGPFVWREHSGSLSCLNTPVSASSLTNLSEYCNFRDKNRQRVDAHFQLKQAVEGPSHFSDDHSEILVVDLKGKHESKEKQTDSFSVLIADSSNKPDSELVNLLTADKAMRAHESVEMETKDEGIYENYPFVREDTPPPALPPKGPALLKKLKAAKVGANMMESRLKQTTPSPTPQRQNKSFNSIYDYSFEMDGCYSTSASLPKDSTVSDVSRGDDQYLHMGSPKTSHKLSATVPISGLSKKKLVSKANVRDDYMDMGVIALEANSVSTDLTHEDEIYLDVDETIRSSKYYNPDSDATVVPGLPPAACGPVRESTYIEMATVSNRKSVVLQNLETLQAVVSKKPGGETPSPSTQLPTTSQPPLPRPYKVRHNSDSGLVSKNTDEGEMSLDKPRTKSPMKIYTKVKSTDSVSKNISEAPVPFENLMDFTKKFDSRPTYVNTYIDAEKSISSLNDLRSIPLPEPVKEGFLARLKRRSSRDKGSPAPDKIAGSRNRSSILERSMSEHGSPKSTKEEKTSKLKIGRRRSSSFPNRLSYQESQDDDPQMPMVKKVESSHNFSSSSLKSKPPVTVSGEPNESNSSVQDFSDDSDVSPLLRRCANKPKSNTVTVMHIQQYQPGDKNFYMHTSRSTSCLVSQIPNSSKTDDEKLSEMIYKTPRNKQMLKDSFDDSTLSDVSFEKICIRGGGPDNKTKNPFPVSHQDVRSMQDSNVECKRPSQEIKNGKEGSSEYCLMGPPKAETFTPLSVAVNPDVDSIPPALPPKNRNYQKLLSPVLETAVPPSLPPRMYKNISSQLNKSASGEGLDQYVELSSQCGDQGKSANSSSSSNPKAGRLSDRLANGEMPMSSDLTYTTISIPITNGHRNSSIRESCDSPVLSTHSFTLEGNLPCTSPAKSVLRPRTGNEYVVIQRIQIPASERARLSHSASLSPPLSQQVFNYDLESERSSHEGLLEEVSTVDTPDCPLLTDPSLQSHTSLPQHPLPQRSPQWSPCTGSQAETIQSTLSLSCEQKDGRQFIHDFNSRATPTSLSVSTCSSLSPSPKVGMSLHHFHSPDLSAKLSQGTLVSQGENIFFPDELSISGSSDLAFQDRDNFDDEDYHVYVNQEPVFRHHRQNSGKRASSSLSCHSPASPHLRSMHSHLSLLRESLPSKYSQDVKRTRVRSRHSESDVARGKKGSHSFSFADRLQKSLTLPPSVHRSNSDPRQGLKMSSSSSHSQSHIHQKKFDKFAQSSIIARRRQQYALSQPKPVNMNSPKGPPISSNVFNFTGGLHVPPIKSSGYKNIDSMNTMPSSGTSLQTSPYSEAPLTPNTMQSQFSPEHSDMSYLSCSSQVIMTSTPISNTKMSPPPVLLTPPPLPPSHRKNSTPITMSPPTSPHTCSLDSPPPYRAPPPPLLPTESTSLIPMEMNSSDSPSEDEQELIYIEIDMTKKTEEVPTIPSVSLSRRSRRAKQQRDLDKLRYVEIDHTATKALQQTSEKLRDDRRSMGSSTLSRKNSSSGKNRKSSVQVSHEHQLSTTSIESF